MRPRPGSAHQHRAGSPFAPWGPANAHDFPRLGFWASLPVRMFSRTFHRLWALPGDSFWGAGVTPCLRGFHLLLFSRAFKGIEWEAGPAGLLSAWGESGPRALVRVT